MPRVEMAERIARRELKLPQNHEMVSIESSKDDIITIEMAECVRFKLDDKDQIKYSNKKIKHQITMKDMIQEEQQYIKETGNCPNCLGKGKETIGWNKTTGIKERICKICQGSGKKDPI